MQFLLRGSLARRTVICTIALVFFCGCKKFVTVTAPATSINSSNVYATDATAAAVLTGIYGKISNNFYGVLPSMSLVGGLSADELTLYSGSSNLAYIGYYTNKLTNINTAGFDFWTTTYSVINTANAAIEGLQASTTLTPAIKRQLLGEAFFVRAFCYFYLVNLYGDVPLAISSDYKVNASLTRAPKVQVWQQIVNDTKNAGSLLNINFIYSDGMTVTSERTRPNKWAAVALAARVYLYTGDWRDAELASDSLISGIAPFPLGLAPNLDSVFLMNSSEAIWQLQPVSASPTNTQDGYMFIIPNTGPNDNYNPVYLSADLLSSFEPNDLRRNGGHWLDSTIVGSTTYFYPYKYKVNDPSATVSEYEMVFRLGEQYLIRAEARARLGNITGALSDLDSIRIRAGLPNYAGAADQASILAAILHERQVELFTEWGNRWLDLKRTANIDAVMTAACPHKGRVWNTNWQLYPILLTELQRDNNLVQNKGY